MSVINRTVERIRLETRLRTLTVASVTDLTPHMRRVRLAGDELEGFNSPGYADHVKVFLSADGKPLPRPERRPDGIVWPEGTPKPLMRDYTPRQFDPVGRTLDIDFVLHGDGPASEWATSVKAGDTLVIGGPRGSMIVPDAFDWYLLVGDETALPAIGRRIEELPQDRTVLAVIEVPEKADEQRFAGRFPATLVWVHRDGREPGAQNLLLPALAEIAFPPGVGYAFVAGEAEMSRSIKSHLVERGFDPEFIRAAGYWTRGEAGD